MRIIFMGTPAFAVASLKALVENGHQVVAVVTSTDKPAGRGQKITFSAVKEYALSQNIPLLQPVKLKDPEFLEELRSYKADLQVVVAFRMLPEVVWNMPPMGTINVHASLLPQYRGAAPINHAIINGEHETGVSTFLLQHEIDTGNILYTAKTPILPEDNAGTLHDKLMELGAETLLKTVEGLKNNSIQPVPQSEIDLQGELKEAPKIFKDFCAINWEQPAKTIHNFIRGLSPYPGAYTQVKGKFLKIFASKFHIQEHNHPVGSYEIVNNKQILFYCTDGYLEVEELQLEGKKKMETKTFLLGNNFL